MIWRNDSNVIKKVTGQATPTTVLNVNIDACTVVDFWNTTQIQIGQYNE